MIGGSQVVVPAYDTPTGSAGAAEETGSVSGEEGEGQAASPESVYTGGASGRRVIAGWGVGWVVAVGVVVGGWAVCNN